MSRSRFHRRVQIALTTTALVLVAVGCSDRREARGRGDGPVGEQDREPAQIIVMPDRFSNVAFKCHGPNGVYVTTRDASATVIAHDPTCTSPSGDG